MQSIHLRAPENWINDPNGFIFFKGEYHLFYQYFPYGACWGTMHWGHAVSSDLVHWEHKGIALFPTVKGDQNGCFSGSAIEKDGRLQLVYTGVRYQQPDPENIHVALDDSMVATQMMISSEDGYQFDNWKGKRVIIPPVTDPLIGDLGHTRDPKIWRGRDAWYLVLGSTDKEKQGKILFYRSKDLLKWDYVNMARIPNPSGWMCECPDYFETEGKGVLLASLMGMDAPNGIKGQYALCYQVTFDESDCEMHISEEYQFIDYGLDLYAPQTTVDKDGRRVMASWLRMPEPVDGKWIGMYCAPRIVEVKNGHIYFRLHPNIRDVFSREISHAGDAGEGGYKIDLEMHDGESINVGGLKIYRQNGSVCVDRSEVYPFDGGNVRLLSATPKVKDGARLEILVDEYIAEIYVNDGEYVISNAVYGLGNEISSDISDIKLYAVEK